MAGSDAGRASVETSSRPSGRRHWFPRAVAVLGGLSFLASGLWAMVAPESFFDAVATFEPYNQHFLQDVGAFQIGLGAILLLALRQPPLSGLAVALLGVGIGNAAHTVSHVLGIDLGGKPVTDISLFALLTVALLWAGWSASRQPAG